MSNCNDSGIVRMLLRWTDYAFFLELTEVNVVMGGDNVEETERPWKKNSGWIPRYGWKVKLDHEFPETRDQTLWPKINQLLPLIPLALRYLVYVFMSFWTGRRPLMNPWNMLTGKQIYGVPIGGIGGGTIGRGFKGEFCRYQLVPGQYTYHTVPANQFIVTVQNGNNKTLYQQVLSSHGKPKNCLSSWKWLFSGSDAEYCALFPRAWTVYNIPEQKIRLVCRQVSPVIPHNYKDSSVPGAVFIWSVENRNDEVRKVSITFTFKNGNGGEEDRAGGCWSESFHQPGHGGVLIHQSFKGMPCTYGIAGSEKNGSTVSWITKFDPWSDGSELWDKLNKFGHLNDHSESSEKLEPGKELACAVCVKCEVPKNEISEAELALVWDMPKIHFVLGCRQYSRYYTKYFGDDGNASMKLIKYVFENSARWEKEIDNWQRPILTDVELPDWYKSAIFNELYYVADGGSIWLLPHESNELGASDPRQVYGHFGYLEGHEYTMYNTYDVHFYASFALALLWPRLQESIQYEILETIGSEDTSMRWHLYDGKRNFRKVKNSVPHDVGDPYEEPFILINAYPIHDVSEWKDLNLKFVLQCYRDYCLFADEQYVKNMWPKVQIVMHKAMEWDKDGDGLIENGGMPDQTYDSWVMKGPSAYCGSLWLAALYSARKMAEVMNDVDQAALYEETLKKAKGAFETKLWNGEYYNFDSSSDTNSRSIMSDQLCGLWYLRACGVTEEVFNGKHVASALRKIFDFNVMKFKNGTMGAVNGMTPDGKIDMVTVQSEEAWTGVVYGLAALMLHEGMVEEAFKTAHGIYNTVYNTIGMGFETPEALYVEKSYRAVGYMRPLSIWGIQHAWEQRQKKKLP